jgi:hypothetical protein
VKRLILLIPLFVLAITGISCDDKNLDWVLEDVELVVLSLDIEPLPVDPDRNVGEKVQFTLRVLNAGAAGTVEHVDAPEFYVDLTINELTTLIAGSPVPVATNGSNWNPTTKRWTIPSLPKGTGNEATLTLSLDIVGGAGSQQCLSAEIVRPQGFPSDQQNNDDDSDAECFDIALSPAIGLSSTAVNFGGQPGGGSPASQVVDISNVGGGSLTGLGESVSYAPGEPTGWLGATLSATTAPATLTLAATTGSLTDGTYTATVTVSSPVAANSPLEITVTFTLSTDPLIGLSSTDLNFGAQTGGADPGPQFVAVNNAGGGALTGLSTTLTYGAGQPTGWLGATLNTNTAPASITLQATTGSLSDGTYTATVAVSSPVAGNSPQTIAVEFTVSAGPAIGLSTSTVDFNAQAGSGNPGAQVVSISNVGGGSLTGLGESVTYGSGQPTGWLGSTLSATTAPANLTLQATTGVLTAGAYTATVVVSSPVAGNSPRNITVTFTVTAAPLIALSTNTVGFAAEAGGSSPASQILSVSNGGGGLLTGLGESVSYAPGEPTGWLGSTLSTTTAPASLTLQATTGSLGAGAYTATVTVSSPVAGNSPQNITVTFTVTAAPVIGLSNGNVNFGAQAGGANPGPQVVNVTNTGGGTLTGLAATVTYGMGQPTGWLGAGLGATTAPAALTLQATTGSLGDGTYTATVAISSPVAGNSPQNITVMLTVSDAPAIGLSTPAVAFGAEVGGANPGSQVVTVSNTGGGSLTGLGESVSYAPGEPTGWLGSTLSATTAPANLTLQATTGSLAVGAYAATVTVTSPVAGNSPQNITVTFTVVARPAIDLSTNDVNFSALQGGSNPGSQIVSISNSGDGSLTGLSATVNYDTATGWLSASFFAGNTTAPAELILQAATGSLAPATYTASVAVSSPVAGNSPQNIAVSFTVIGPAISLSNSSVSFGAQAGGGNPAENLIVVTNGGGGSLTGLGESVTYGAGEPTGWLGSTLHTTTAPAVITLQATTGSLTAGTYTATVLVTSPVAGNSPQNITVTFTVTAAPAISLSDIDLNFGAQEGSGDPVAQVIVVSNSGGGSLTGLATTINYGSGSGWMNATFFAATTAPAALTLQPTTGSLAPGTYTATVSVTSPVASNSPQNVAITFVVSAQPAIGLSGTTTDFNALEGGADPASQVVNVSNMGEGSLTGLSTSIVYDTGSGWLAADLDVTTAPAALTIQAMTGILTPGIYTATVSVTSLVAGNSPQDILVSFTVSALPAIGLSSSTADFGAQEGGGDPASQVVDITNTGGGSLTGLAASIVYDTGSGWLAADLDVTTAPAALTIQATTGILTPGIYTATVSVTSLVAGNSPQDILVSFTIGP